MLNETMAKQTRQALKTLRAAIENCPDKLGGAGSGNYLVAARLAFYERLMVLTLQNDPRGATC